MDGGPGGGLHLAFFHSKGPKATGYTPEGMTAEEILAIPGAKEWWPDYAPGTSESSNRQTEPHSEYSVRLDHGSRMWDGHFD